MADDEVRDRKLLIIATGEYVDEHWEKLEVESETRVWREWLTDPSLEERRFTAVFEALANSPSLGQLDETLQQDDAFHRRDAVVCYITGHGEVTDRDHWLVLSASKPGKPGTGLDTRRLLRWLKEQDVGRALVVIDTCYAGEIAGYLAALNANLPAGWVGIATASAQKRARLGALTAAIEEFSWTGADDDTQPYLDYWQLMPALAAALKDQRWQFFGTPPDPANSRLVCLPNRYYRSLAAEQVQLAPARQDMAILSTDLAAHWDPRSRGVRDTATAGVYFNGRDKLMVALLSAARGNPGASVITGAAGCGKSAVLSRLVTLSDPSARERYGEDLTKNDPALLPDVGDVDIAVLASGKVSATCSTRSAPV